jgi:hypothetical protein
LLNVLFQTNQSPVQQEKTTFVQKAFDYFVRRPYDAAKNFFTPEELSKTAKSVSSLRPKWPEVSFIEKNYFSAYANNNNRLTSAANCLMSRSLEFCL